MQKVDFDLYSNEYNTIMEKAHEKYGDISYYSSHKVNITKKIFHNSHCKILEYGCGVGRNLNDLKNAYPDSSVYGFDISEESLAIAQKQNPEITLLLEKNIKNYSNYFDIIFIAGVYHHIHPSIRNEVTENIRNLLKVGGRMICFEHNPYNPLTRHMVSTCAFDDDAILLTKSESELHFLSHQLVKIQAGYTLFFPPKLSYFSWLEKYISWIPLGGQYFVAFKKSTD